MVKHQYLCLVVLTEITLAANCGWNQWSKWGKCEAKPGSCQPIQTRLRQCRGRSSCCEGQRAQVQKCGSRVSSCDECSSWSACCKVGDKFQRSRTCAAGFIIQRTETEGCDPLNQATVSEWSECSKTCGVDAVKFRTVTYPSCDNEAPRVEMEQALCGRDEVGVCLNIVDTGNGENSSVLERMQATIDEYVQKFDTLLKIMSQRSQPVQAPSEWSQWSECVYESDTTTQVCTGIKLRTKDGETEKADCPEPYLEWTGWTFAENGLTGQMISNQQFRTRHLDYSNYAVEKCSPQLQTREQVNPGPVPSSMPDLSKACSYSSIPSAIFTGATQCVVELNQQMIPYLPVGFECEEPYGEWTQWATFDAQTESRTRYKSDLVISNFVCDYVDRDLRLIPQSRPANNQPISQFPGPATPNSQVWSDSVEAPDSDPSLGKPVNPANTAIAVNRGDGYKVCYWCQRLTGGLSRK